MPVLLYKLIKKGTEFEIIGSVVNYIEWGEKNSKAVHSEPLIGRSLVLDLQLDHTYVWLTTPITEIIESEHLLEFKTGNSHYILDIFNLGL